MCHGTNMGCKLFQSVALVFEWKDDEHKMKYKFSV